SRHALYPLGTGFEFQLRECTAADHATDDLAVAAMLAGAVAEQLDLPALRLRVACVHAKQIAGEDRGFVPTGSGADLEVDVALVALIAGEQQLQQLPSPQLPLQPPILGERLRGRLQPSVLDR